MSRTPGSSPLSLHGGHRPTRVGGPVGGASPGEAGLTASLFPASSLAPTPPASLAGSSGPEARDQSGPSARPWAPFPQPLLADQGETEAEGQLLPPSPGGQRGGSGPFPTGPAGPILPPSPGRERGYPGPGAAAPPWLCPPSSSQARARGRAPVGQEPPLHWGRAPFPRLHIPPPPSSPGRRAAPRHRAEGRATPNPPFAGWRDPGGAVRDNVPRVTRRRSDHPPPSLPQFPHRRCLHIPRPPPEETAQINRAPAPEHPTATDAVRKGRGATHTPPHPPPPSPGPPRPTASPSNPRGSGTRGAG